MQLNAEGSDIYHLYQWQHEKIKGFIYTDKPGLMQCMDTVNGLCNDEEQGLN